jgi:hypothetical protein
MIFPRIDNIVKQVVFLVRPSCINMKKDIIESTDEVRVLDTHGIEQIIRKATITVQSRKRGSSDLPKQAQAQMKDFSIKPIETIYESRPETPQN